LNASGQQAVEITAERVAGLVDELLEKTWSRRAGTFAEPVEDTKPQEEKQATCSCGSGIPIQKVVVDGQTVTLVALPLIFQKFRDAGKAPSDGVVRELLEVVKVYHDVPAEAEAAYVTMLAREYAAFCERQGQNA